MASTIVKKVTVGVPISGVTSGAFSITNLAGVDVTGVGTGDMLVYDASTSKFLADSDTYLKTADSAEIKSLFSAGGDLTYDSASGQFSFDVESVYTKANFDSDLVDATVAGTLRFADGSASAPSVSNTDDTNTGMFFPTADTIGFSVGGTSQVQLSDGFFGPTTDSDVDLGSSTKKFKDLYLSGGSIHIGGLILSDNNNTLKISDSAGTEILNTSVIDGTTSATSTTVADADRIVMNDDGTMKQVAVTDLAAYFDDEITAMPNLVSTGALDTGSITSGFGTINTGASTITTTGLISGGSLDIDDVLINGTTIGHTDDTDLITLANGLVTVAGEISVTTLDIGGTNVTSTAAELNILDGVTSTAAELNILDGVTASAADINLIDGITNGTVIASKAIVTDANKDITGGRNITISGELDAATLDISGDADIDGTLEADAITIGGVTLAETISDTVGAMVTSNTETGISVTYDDADNTLDFVIGTLNQDTTGNAGTATALETARTIHGVSFDGTANIDLSEVISDTVGAMVGSNTETGIAVTYQDGDNTIDFALDAAQTTITSLLATDIKIGEDDQTKIDFETADEIHFYAANAHQIKLVDGALIPVTDDDIDLGTSSLEFKNAFFDGTVTSDAFAGPLTGNVTGNVSGTAATVTGAAQTNITSLGTLTALTVDNVVINGATIGHTDDTDLMTVADGILTVAGEISVTTLDIGGTNVTSTAAELNILDGVTSTAAELNLLDGSSANSVVNSKAVVYGSSGELAGTLSTAAQGNITSLGTLTTLTVDDITINGSTISDGGDLTVDVGGNIILDADGGDVNFKDDGVETLRYSSSASGPQFFSPVSDKDIIFKGNDGGSTITALTLDMSDAGAATFNDKVIVPDGKLVLTSTAVTSTAAELNILDGVTATTAEINLLDGGTSATSTTVADEDRIILNDNGTMKQVAMSDINTYTSSGTTVAADDINAGDAAVTITTSSGNITIDAAANDTDIIFKGTDSGVDTTFLTIDGSAAGAATFNAGVIATTGVFSGILKTDDATEATSTTDGSLQTDGGLSVAKDVVAGNDIKLLSDASVVAFGADGDVTLTHVADTGLLLNGTSVIQFNDASQNIGAPSGTVLDINATDEIELNATLVDINANVEISGNLTVSGTTTQVDTVTMNAQNAVVFEGATADDHETTLTIVDPTGDRTINLPNVSGTLPVLAAASTTQITSTPEELNILDGVTSTAAELNILDGVTATAAEINLIDGDTARGTTAVADGDGFLTNDGGTMRMTKVDTLATYMASKIANMGNLVETGALNAGTITSGFGNINTGSSTITTTGAVATGALTAGGILKTDDTTEATSTTDGSLQTDGGLSVAKDVVAGDDIILLSDASVIHFGANKDVNLTHVHNAGLTLNVPATADNSFPTFTLAAGDNDIAADDVLGAISFVAPAEGSGTDAVAVAASIQAISEGNFAADNNATKMSFMLGASEAATEKASLSSAGVFATASLDISGDVDIDGTANLDVVDIDGAVDFASTTAHAGNATFADNAKVQLGADADLQIYHDGSNARIRELTGELRLQTTSSGVNALVAKSNAAVELFHAGSKKVETTSTGISVTGTVTATGTSVFATLDISGDVDVDGTLEADAITLGGTALATSATTDTTNASNIASGTLAAARMAAAQTAITSILATDVKIGEDDQTKIDFETADEIHFYAANAHQIKLVDGALVPVTDNDIDLGTSSLEFKNAYFDGTVTSDAFAGPLTGDVTGNVSGSAATVTGAAQSAITSLGTLTDLTVDDITINGSNITDAGDIYIDVGGDIHLNADGGDIKFEDDAVEFGRISNSASSLQIYAPVQDKDINFLGNDGGSTITALSLDMSDSGSAHFKKDIYLTDNAVLRIGTGQDFRLYHDASHSYIHSTLSDADIVFKGNDGGSAITALTLDMSAAGAATFNSTVTATGFSGPLTGNVTGNVSGTAATVTGAAQSNITSLGTLTTLTVDDITINGSTISDAGALTLDVGGDITLDAAGANISLKNGGTEYGKFNLSSNNLNIHSSISDGDIIFKGNDGGSTITAFQLNMSDAGAAVFNNTVTATGFVGPLTGNVTGNTSGTAATVTTAAQPNITSLGTLTTLTVDDITINGSTISDAADLSIDVGADLTLDAGGGDIIISDDGTIVGTLSLNTSDFLIRSRVSDKDLIFKGNDGGSEITALTLDMSQAGRATFNEGIVAKTSAAGDFGLNLNTHAGDSMKLQVVDTGTAGAADGTISVSDGDLTLDVAGDIILDAGGAEINLKDDGTTVGHISMASSHLEIFSAVSDKDMIFKGNDGGSTITALTFDMSDSGSAAFNHNISVPDAGEIQLGADGDFRFFHDGSHNYIKGATSDQDVIIQGNDGGSIINALTLDMSAAGAATFNNKVIATELDISGNADIDGTMEADAYTVNGTALAEYIADTVGAMVGSNTESGISVVYQDADNTLDFTVGTLNQNTTGSAATLTTGRTIGMTGDVVWTSASFNGSGNVTGTSTIQSGAVETGMIAADAITGAKIADDAINSEHYTDGSIDTAHLADDAVTGAKIANATIAAANIANNTITAGQIASNAIGNSELGTNAVEQVNIADDAVGSAELKTLATLLILDSAGSTLRTFHCAGA